MKYCFCNSLLSTCLMLAIALTGCDKAVQHPQDLPWQIDSGPTGNPVVFRLEVGRSTLKDMIGHLHSFPEVAVFAQENGKRTLEAYFGTQRVGLFEAKFIAELQADDAQLDRFQQQHGKREGMASGQWKYSLSEADTRLASDLLIQKLIYLPMIDYEPDIVNARFGEPAERLPATREGVEYWFYPQHSLAILMNAKGGEILYYTTPGQFAALRQSLLEAGPRDG